MSSMSPYSCVCLPDPPRETPTNNDKTTGGVGTGDTLFIHMVHILYTVTP